MCRGKSEFPGEATTAVAEGAEPGGLFPESACPLPSRLWQVVLEPPGALTAPEQAHLRECGRCCNHLARVRQAVECADGADDEVFAEAEAAALVAAALPAEAARVGRVQ
jgi:hypothetical protein